MLAPRARTEAGRVLAHASEFLFFRYPEGTDQSATERVVLEEGLLIIKGIEPAFDSSVGSILSDRFIQGRTVLRKYLIQCLRSQHPLSPRRQCLGFGIPDALLQRRRQGAEFVTEQTHEEDRLAFSTPLFDSPF